MRFIMPNAAHYIGWMTYVERLRVPLWWWLMVLLVVATAAVAVLAFVPPLAGWVCIGLFALAVGLVIFSYGHTAIKVTDGVLQVGRNTIHGQWIGTSDALNREESSHALGAGADTTDLLLTRPYIGELVRITIADEADPHRHWLVSSRRPQEFSAAVAAAALDKS